MSVDLDAKEYFVTESTGSSYVQVLKERMDLSVGKDFYCLLVS